MLYDTRRSSKPILEACNESFQHRRNLDAIVCWLTAVLYQPLLVRLYTRHVAYPGPALDSTLMLLSGVKCGFRLPLQIPVSRLTYLPRNKTYTNYRERTDPEALKHSLLSLW